MPAASCPTAAVVHQLVPCAPQVAQCSAEFPVRLAKLSVAPCELLLQCHELFALPFESGWGTYLCTERDEG